MGEHSDDTGGFHDDIFESDGTPREGAKLLIDREGNRHATPKHGGGGASV